MSMFVYLLEAWVIGVAIAAPVGPIGMLFIRKTLEIGFKSALSVGLGAALADGCYGFIAGVGLTTITHFLLEKALFLKMGGGLFLLYLGIAELKRSKIASPSITPNQENFFKLTCMTFFLTLTSPFTILTFLGIFAGIADNTASLENSLWMTFGVFLGSMCWWIFLGQLISWTKSYLSPRWLYNIRCFSSYLLMAFGTWSIISSIIVFFP